MTAALMEMAAVDGFPVNIIPAEHGIMPEERFFSEVVTAEAHWVDNPLLNTSHTASMHLIQDIVVNRAFKAAGRYETGFGAVQGFLVVDLAVEIALHEAVNGIKAIEVDLVGRFNEGVGQEAGVGVSGVERA